MAARFVAVQRLAAVAGGVLLAACATDLSRLPESAFDRPHQEAPRLHLSEPTSASLVEPIENPQSVAPSVEATPLRAAGPVSIQLEQLHGAWIRADLDRSSPDQDPARECMVFSPDQVVHADALGQSISTVALVDGKLRMQAVPDGRMTLVTASVTGSDQLRLGDAGGEFTDWIRAQAVPSFADIEPRPLGVVDPARDMALEIAGDLASRTAREQTLRMELVSRARTNPDAVFDPVAGAALREADRDDQQYLLSVLQIHGWIDVARFGNDARRDALRVLVQSGSIALRMTALPALLAELEPSASAKGLAPLEADGLVRWVDQALGDAGKPQRYGTRFVPTEDNALRLVPLMEPSRLAERRQAAGLAPFAGFVDSLRANGLAIDSASIPALALRTRAVPRN